MSRGDGECAMCEHTWSRSSTGLMNLVNYKKEYLNLFSSNNHEQAYRPRGCCFNSSRGGASRWRYVEVVGVGDLVSVFFAWAFVWGDVDPHSGDLGAGESVSARL
jgi:hypothetical protein